MAKAEPMALDALQPAAILESCNKLLIQIDELNRAWMGSVHDANQAGWDLAARLARCGDPLEAGHACTEWINRQRDQMLDEGRKLSGLWLKLCEPSLPLSTIAANVRGIGTPPAPGMASRSIIAAE